MPEMNPSLILVEVFATPTSILLLEHDERPFRDHLRSVPTSSPMIDHHLVII